MKFTKEAWSKLNEQERSWLAHYHQNCNKVNGQGWNMPEGCSYCPVCGQPQIGGMTCIKCLDNAEKLYGKMKEGTK